VRSQRHRGLRAAARTRGRHSFGQQWRRSLPAGPIEFLTHTVWGEHERCALGGGLYLLDADGSDGSLRKIWLELTFCSFSFLCASMSAFDDLKVNWARITAASNSEVPETGPPDSSFVPSSDVNLAT
jgi:hypothetical protein